MERRQNSLAWLERSFLEKGVGDHKEAVGNVFLAMCGFENELERLQLD